MNGTPSIFVYKSRANMAWSPKYTLTTILSYYFIYDYTFIIIGNYKFNHAKFYITKLKNDG
jgi:hypothetical protein